MNKWMDEASCKDAPTEWFYPEGAEINENALFLCEKCPVQKECRDYGITKEEWGIWGGLSASKRKRLRKELGIVLNQSMYIPKPPHHNNCGTNAGYIALMRHYEKFPNVEKIKCEFCSLAHRELKRTIILEEDRLLKRRERDRRRKARKAIRSRMESK